MYEASYAHTKKLSGVTPQQAIAKVKEALAAEGFGVLTEIDVQATLKQKLGVDRRPYVILGACNPTLAHQALEAEPSVGVFMPCNVDVLQGEDGATYVQAIRAQALLERVQHPKVKALAEEADQKLRRALDKLA